MGIGQSIRKLADRAKEKVQPEQAERGVDKAGNKINEKTGGEHEAKVEKGKQRAGDAAKKYFRGK